MKRITILVVLYILTALFVSGMYAQATEPTSYPGQCKLQTTCTGGTCQTIKTCG
jgi:hypothetical protein